jgi:hypothetical protein
VAPNFSFKAFLLFNILRPKVPKSTDYRLPKSPQKQATDYQTIKSKKHRLPITKNTSKTSNRLPNYQT